MQDIQRARILAALVQATDSHGVPGLSVSHIVSRAGVSRRTFYEIFSDVEDCFLEAFDHSVSRIAARVLPAYESERTVRVLLAIGAAPGASNRQIGEHAGIADQGQISKLLHRLQRLGLIENGADTTVRGLSNSWRLTAKGEALQHVIETGPGR